jgi:hypothetical protein
MNTRSLRSFVLALAFALVPVSGIAGDDATEAKGAAEIKVAITYPYLMYLVSRLPKEAGIEPIKIIKPREMFEIPDGVKEVAAPRRLKDEDQSAFQQRLAAARISPKDAIKMATCLPRFHAEVKGINEKLAEIGKKCEEITGTKLCVEVESKILTSPDVYAKELNDNKITFVIYTPDDWKMVSDVSYDKSNREVPASLDSSKVGHVEIALHVPEIKKLGFRVPEMDMGSVVIAWNRNGLRQTMEKSGEAAVAKAVAAFDKGAAELSPEDLKKIGEKLGMGPLGTKMGIATARMVVEKATRTTLSAVGRAIDQKVLCPNEMEADATPHRPEIADRKAERGRKVTILDHQ